MAKDKVNPQVREVTISPGFHDLFSSSAFACEQMKPEASITATTTTPETTVRREPELRMSRTKSTTFHVPDRFGGPGCSLSVQEPSDDPLSRPLSQSFEVKITSQVVTPDRNESVEASIWVDEKQLAEIADLFNALSAAKVIKDSGS